MTRSTNKPSAAASAPVRAGTTARERDQREAAPRRRPYAIAARELLRETLLDAAMHELDTRRWADVTMADIARSAGVSRQTLYNEFGSREVFSQVLAMREAARFLDSVEDAVRSNHDDPAAALAAAFDVFLTGAAENPLVRTIVARDGSEELLALFTTQGKPLVETAAERLTDVLCSTWPQVGPAEVEVLSELLVRLAISYAALPKGPASTTASSIAELLGPYVEQLVRRSAQAVEAGA